MPELPDMEVYREALQSRLQHRQLRRVDVHSPFVLRTATPSLDAVVDREVETVERIGKRLAIGLTGEHWLVLHLMIAGRLQWRKPDYMSRSRNLLAAFRFDHGTLTLTEAGSKRRAALHLVAGEDALMALDPGGVEPLEADFDTFDTALRANNHTLKRALTDPRIFSGIGNSCSDEILHAARLSPMRLSQRLEPEESRRLFEATQRVLTTWWRKLREQTGDGFPEKVTAFRDDMAVRGRYGEPCPDCGTKIQRIRYASNETNYCPRCQNEGRLLADRALSKLLKQDWPRTIEELEEARRG